MNVGVENHDPVLLEMIRTIGRRLFAADILQGLEKIDLNGMDLVAANRMTRQALVAVGENRLGYVLVYAAKTS